MKKIFFACAVFVCTVTLAHAKFDPGFSWTSLETPHFMIHYHQGGEEIAKRTALIAEDVHAQLVPRIRWEPKGKTQVVLVDAMDEANGMTTVLPYNQMILFLTQPLGEPGFGTTPYDDWLRMLIIHEYVHVLQLDMENGGYGGLIRTLLGRSPFSFPNAFQPEWLIEGLATYEETELTSGGRGRSAGADMILRMAVLEEAFPLLSQMTVFPDTWPSGQVPYLFGASFTKYLADKYGRDKLADLSLVYSGRYLPFLVNSTARKSLGSYYGRLYHEWKAFLREKYAKQRAEVEAQGITPSAALTGTGYETLAPAWSPDGGRIAYLVANGDEFPGLYIMNADGSGSRKLTENLFPTSAAGTAPAWSPDGGRIYYTKEEVVRNTNLYNDIYYYDLQKDREVRLTRDLRARDPHPAPDGRKIVFVVNKLGGTRLAVLDLENRKAPAGEKEIVFLSEDDALQYETPRWSPDGTRIAAGVRRQDGRKDIVLLDAAGRKLEDLTHDRAIDGAPAWSPDGRMLYFTSDRTGIYNLYAYQLDTKQLLQITNVLSGAFTPNPAPDNKKLVFTSYSSRGYDIHAMAISPEAGKPAEPYKDTYPAVRYQEQAVDMQKKPYSPLPTLLPRFWLPWIGYSSESGTLGGFLTFGQDVVQRHQYAVTGLYGPGASRFWYSLDYLYDGLSPTIRLHASDQDEVYTDLLSHATGSYDYTEGRKRLGAAMILPLIKTRQQHMITLGYQREEASALTDLTPFSEQPFAGDLASGRVSYLFNSARKYTFSISPEQGRTIEAGYERMADSLGSDIDLSRYTADWHEYINFPFPHHVLQARVFAGTSTGQRIPQGAFQLGGDMPGDMTLSIDDREIYLRGYPVNEFRGRKAALVSLEYRFPISNIERGAAQTPFFLRRLHGAVFAEAGNVWDAGAFHGADLKRAVGAEARLDMDLAYGLAPLTFRLGFAKGLDEEGEAQLILNFWLPFGF